MSEPPDDDEPYHYHLAEAEASATHRVFALAELRSQGCQHSDLSYDEEFDSYYCETCNIWADPLCTDSRCTYCKRRPVVPSLAHRD